MYATLTEVPVCRLASSIGNQPNPSESESKSILIVYFLSSIHVKSLGSGRFS